MNEQTATTAFTKKPRFIVSILGGKRRDMNATLDSLRAQTYGEWTEDAAEQSFPHDYVLRIHAGDTLHPDALFRMAHAVERAEYEPDMIYADELIQEGKKPYEEHKKCEFSRVTALSYDMFGALLAIRREIYAACCPPQGEYDAGAEYAFRLRCMAKARRIVHIPLPLIINHSPAATPAAAGISAIRSYLEVERREESVSTGLWQGSFIVRARREPRLTSFIIPSLNELEPLRRLLESIDRCCMAYRHEIIIADGSSGDGRLLNYYDLLEKNKAARIAKNGTAGFSALCRAGADMAMGDALLFISRDAELIEPNTLYALSSQGERGGAAAAGCMLISPQGALIAAGGAISKDEKIIYPADNERLTHTVRTVSVLSGACMYMRADMYFSSGGFDESFDAPQYEPLLPVGADAELCLRLARRGLGAMYAPDARVVLHRPLAAISSAPENVRLRCRDALRHLSINGDPYAPSAR